MKLLSDFYNILETKDTEHGISYKIKFNENHAIYKAHFPEQHITPGVCIIQIAEELLELHLKCNLELSDVSNVKFMNVLSPEDTPEVEYNIINITNLENSKIKAQVQVVSDSTIYAKLSLIYAIA